MPIIMPRVKKTAEFIPLFYGISHDCDENENIELQDKAML